MRRLVEHGQERHAPSDGQLLRYANGRPITQRRYDHLWARIGRHLTWVATQQISTHWIRPTILTWVERNFGYAVARAYAGHSDGGSEVGSAATYVRAGWLPAAIAVTLPASRSENAAPESGSGREWPCTRRQSATSEHLLSAFLTRSLPRP